MIQCGGWGGWGVGKDRVSRIWRKEGLNVPKKQKSRPRLCLNDGGCVRLRAEQANHVRSYDFEPAWTHDWRVQRLLTLLDDPPSSAWRSRWPQRIGTQEVNELLADVTLVKGLPEHIRSNCGPEFTAKALREWLQ